MPNYDEKFMKAKVREYNDVIKTNFWGDKIPKKCTSHLYSLYNYWFCYKKGWKELSTSLFIIMQV